MGRTQHLPRTVDYVTRPFKRPMLVSYGFELGTGDLHSTSGNGVSSIDRLGWGVRAEGRHYFEYEGHLLYASAKSTLQFASYPTSTGTASGTGLSVSASLGYSF